MRTSDKAVTVIGRTATEEAEMAAVDPAGAARAETAQREAAGIQNLENRNLDQMDCCLTLVTYVENGTTGSTGARSHCGLKQSEQTRISPRYQNLLTTTGNRGS